ncbi:anti-sigma factor family protein [Pseudochryseolinea flava]|uniref:Uncharacterized protein n=1 Tax=Pseudochryseolinea flava TaxID=2059302 RepID=A0A364XXH8_9BACT|nr:hypothetical protein [Pseudochryseolinea flava]RAV98108.1 hypothetical protein DQQ10_25585 [Pseudochryseolinea flava]
MASERDLELLDDYVSNRLAGAEKSAFEQKLEGDPALKREYQVQSKIAEALRTARAAQLKAMLGAIPTPAIQGGGESSLLSKVGMWVAASAVVGAGVYFWLNSNDASEKVEEPVTQAPDTTTQESMEAVAPAEEAPETTQTPAANSDESTSQTAPAKKPITAKKDSGSTSAQGAPKIDAFDPTAEESGNNNVAASPEAVVAASEEPVSNKEQTHAEIISGHKKYKFHYQFKNDKVLLYGPFQANLYEIMEFFGGPQQTVFLFHNSTYYMMTNDGDKIKPLLPIKDPKLINKLDESRKIK